MHADEHKIHNTLSGGEKKNRRRWLEKITGSGRRAKGQGRQQGTGASRSLRGGDATSC